MITGGPCRDLRDNREVKVTGVIEGAGRVLASRVEIRK